MLLLLAPALAADRFVVVSPGAVLHAGSRVGTVDAWAGAVMRLVDKRDGVLVVTAVGDDDPAQCGLGGARPRTDIRFTVDEAATEPVLTRTWTEDRGGGTSITVRAGMPLALRPDGAWDTTASSPRITIHPPPDVLGFGFEADAKWPVPVVEVDTDGHSMAYRFGDGSTIEAFYMEAVRQRPIGGGLWEVGGRCVSIVARPTWDATLEMRSGRIWDAGSFAIPRGTALTWLDGTPAGHLLEDTKVDRIEDAAGRTCFRLFVAGAAFSVCAAG